MRIPVIIEVKPGPRGLERAIRLLRKESDPILRDFRLKTYAQSRSQRRRQKDFRAAERRKKAALFQPHQFLKRESRVPR